MVYDLSPGDVIHIGDAATLTVVAVEGDLIHFELESPEADCPGTDIRCEEADLQRQQGWWELN